MRDYPRPTSPSEGNSEQYNVDHLQEEESALKGKTIVTLGSSITYGYGSETVAFGDMIQKIDQCTVIKQAISGRTLAYNPAMPKTKPEESYVKQLLDHIPTDKTIDAFVVQLSTNDAQKGIAIGDIKDSFDIKLEESDTVTGAIEFICAYIKEKWNCPIIFYINAYLSKQHIIDFANAHPDMPSTVDEAVEYLIDNYQNMIARLYDLQKKWDFEIVDLWNDPEIKNVTSEERNLYMSDVIHPNKAGYLFWYVPKIEEALIKCI